MLLEPTVALAFAFAPVETVVDGVPEPPVGPEPPAGPEPPVVGLPEGVVGGVLPVGFDTGADIAQGK